MKLKIELSIYQTTFQPQGSSRSVFDSQLTALDNLRKEIEEWLNMCNIRESEFESES